jgi:hypothetical protein
VTLLLLALLCSSGLSLAAPAAAAVAGDTAHISAELRLKLLLCRVVRGEVVAGVVPPGSLKYAGTVHVVPELFLRRGTLYLCGDSLVALVLPNVVLPSPCNEWRS